VTVLKNINIKFSAQLHVDVAQGVLVKVLPNIVAQVPAKLYLYISHRSALSNIHYSSNQSKVTVSELGEG